MNGIYGHGGVFLLSKSEELSTTGGSTDFPRTGAADRDDRKPVTGDYNALCDFCRPPDQLRALIHLERVFNGFVTTFTPNRVTSPHVSSCRPDTRPGRAERLALEYSQITR